ncbi:hypothetical protein OB955_03785 [Halobacteria archaeon AArc-m2/3/4]|uniref:DUF4386 family protein n=1 Tax=Natronoglomus mannanivorans TaxID=2979990 RepID=A0ABT2QAB1_9EURY|nr:hypothetical protein [Halobacteria archaeon AArc-m2/3/4]
MSRGQTTPVGLVIGLFVGNLAYLLFTVILSMVLGIAPTDVFSGPFAEGANSLVSGWVAIGGLLGVTDVLVVVGFVSSVFGGR